MFGLVAFIFTKYFQLSETQLFLINLAGFILLVAIIWIGAKLKKEIDNIEEM